MILKIRNLFILLIGLLAFMFSSGRWNIPIMAWIWPVCILFYLRKTNKAFGIILTCISMILVAIVKWYGIVGITLEENLLSGCALGLVAFHPFCIDFLLNKKIKGLKSTLLLPLAFASEEYLMQYVSTGMIGAISATQANNQPLIQIASIFGSYSITFLVIWFASICLYAFENYEDHKKINKSILLYLLVMVITLSYGGIRLAFSDYSIPSVKIAMTTGPYTGDFLTGEDATWAIDKNIESMNNSVKTAAEGKADIVLFSEEAFNVKDTDENTMIISTAQAAISNNIFVVLAMEVDDTDNSQNGLCSNVEYLIDNNGKIVWKYEKYHLVAFMETGSVLSGDGKIPNETVELPSGLKVKLASVICMDSDFSDYIRDGLDNDTDILLVPTWDWDAIRSYHSNWVELRAVENGVSFARSGMDGVSVATDQYSRVVMHSDTASTGYENVVFSEVPSKKIFTIYKYVGDYIDWLYVVGFVVLVLDGLKNYVKSRKVKKADKK